MKSKVNDLDLDVLSYSKKLTEGEGIFYIRIEEEQAFSTIYGDSGALISALTTAMEESEDTCELFSASVANFTGNTNKEIKEEFLIDDIYDQYNMICAGMVISFANKHGVEFSGWLDGRVGTKAVFGESAFNFSDVVYDMEQEMPSGVIWQYLGSGWEDYAKYCSYLENNSSYCSTCDTLVDSDLQDWANDQPLCCYCGGKLGKINPNSNH